MGLLFEEPRRLESRAMSRAEIIDEEDEAAPRLGTADHGTIEKTSMSSLEQDENKQL